MYKMLSESKSRICRGEMLRQTAGPDFTMGGLPEYQVHRARKKGLSSKGNYQSALHLEAIRIFHFFSMGLQKDKGSGGMTG